MKIAHAVPPHSPSESSLHDRRLHLLDLVPKIPLQALHTVASRARVRFWLKIVSGATGFALIAGLGTDLALRTFRADTAREPLKVVAYSDIAPQLYQWLRFYRVTP